MKIKKLLPVYASSYYQILMRELNKDFKVNRKDKKMKLEQGTCYEKCVKLSNGDVKYKVHIECLDENKDYRVRMDFKSYSQIVSHHIEQLDDDGVIRVTYEEKVEGCSFLSQCLFVLKGRYMRMKVMQFINYLYKEAEALEEVKG